MGTETSKALSDNKNTNQTAQRLVPESEPLYPVYGQTLKSEDTPTSPDSTMSNLQVEGWEEIKNVEAKPVGHHAVEGSNKGDHRQGAAPAVLPPQPEVRQPMQPSTPKAGR